MTAFLAPITLSDTDAAYAAGIFDGEGYIFFQNPGKGHGRPRPQIEIESIDQELIEWLYSKCGGYKPKAPAPKENRRQTYRWRINGRRAQAVLRRTYPYMKIERKRKIVGPMLRW